MLTLIYVQPMGRLALLALVLMLGYGAVFDGFRRHRPLAKKVTGMLLAFWLFGVLLVTLSRGGGTRELNLMPFSNVYRGFTENKEMFRTIFMNVLLFLPGGFLGAALCRNRSQVRGLFLGLLLLSFAIELFQYVFSQGRTETDDLLANGLGAFFGILFWNVIQNSIKLLRKTKDF